MKAQYSVRKGVFLWRKIHLFQKTLSESTANGNCRTEIARPKGTVVSISMSSSRGAKLGSLSNHDDDSYTNPTNLHIWQWKTVFLHALHVHFSSFDILKTFSSFLWREMTFFAVVWTTWAYNDKCSILSCPKRWFQFKSRIVKAHFSGIMTLNTWKIIAETQSDSFRWRSRFRRRRVCVSFLLILPHERPTGPGLIWQTIWLAIEGRHCMEPASLELISY